MGPLGSCHRAAHFAPRQPCPTNASAQPCPAAVPCPDAAGGPQVAATGEPREGQRGASASRPSPGWPGPRCGGSTSYHSRRTFPGIGGSTSTAEMFHLLLAAARDGRYLPRTNTEQDILEEFFGTSLELGISACHHLYSDRHWALQRRPSAI